MTTSKSTPTTAAKPEPAAETKQAALARADATCAETTQSAADCANSLFDALIIGGGSAGASCALWLKLLGLNPCIIERNDRLGGLQADSPYLNPWIVSSRPQAGSAIAAEMQHNILTQGIACRFSETVRRLEKNTQGFTVHSANGNKLRGKTLVLASGVRPVSGNLNATPRLLIGPSARIAQHNFAGQSVAILGGGDNAFEHYLLIKATSASQNGTENGNVAAAKITLFARSIRARQAFRAQIPDCDIQLGEYQVCAEQNSVNHQHYDWILVMYGWTPELNYAQELGLARDERGFLRTDTHCQTSVPGIYAIGEVTQRMHPCCVTAMADGVVAAKAIERTLIG
ncbi:MAG: FAD-dependent oxidoreductase [Pseudomonadota bacterium]